jgi:hypothetical protein
VLFVGNSLTYGNDLPGVVEAMAAAGGVRLYAASVALSNFSLEEHWKEGASRPTLAASRWDYLVLQQGLSSRPENQVNLREWAVRWADEARRHGVKPALYMVWPFRGQKNGFEQVSQSYRAAAKASDARIFPAGEAWQEALRRDPATPLYHKDGLHPTPAGTYLAALVVTHGLTGVEPRSVPARLKLGSGSEFTVPDDVAERLRRAAKEVLGK